MYEGGVTQVPVETGRGNGVVSLLIRPFICSAVSILYPQCGGGVPIDYGLIELFANESSAREAETDSAAPPNECESRGANAQGITGRNKGGQGGNTRSKCWQIIKEEMERDTWPNFSVCSGDFIRP